MLREVWPETKCPKCKHTREEHSNVVPCACDVAECACAAFAGFERVPASQVLGAVDFDDAGGE